MKLQPINTTDTVTYPSRSARWSRVYQQARRVGAVLSTAAFLTFGGCVESTPMEGGPEHATSEIGEGGGSTEGTGGEVTPERVLEVCEPDYRLSGDVAGPEFYFACGVVLPEDTPNFELPLWAWGQTCDDGSSWATFDVIEASRLQVSFPSGPSAVVMAIHAPDGSLVVELDDESPCFELDAEPGTWSIAITAPETGEMSWFEIAVDVVSE